MRKYYATKNGMTLEIQKQSKDIYELMGYAITTSIDESNSKIDYYDYDDVSESGDCLQPVIINGESFFGYSNVMNINTKTYVEEPSRTIDGSIPNINDYDTFVVPRFKITFKYMDIKEYRRLLKAVSGANEFDVTYYDVTIDKIVTHKMYCEPLEMNNLLNRGYKLLGMTDISISLIGTLNNILPIKIKYLVSKTHGMRDDDILLGEEDLLFGTFRAIASPAKYPIPYDDGGYDYIILDWNTRKDIQGERYIPNQTFIASESLNLYANFERKPKMINVIYDLDGGSNVKENPTSFEYAPESYEYLVLYAPHHKEYTFKGWFTNPERTNQVMTIRRNTTKDVYLYAKWE